MQPIIKKATNKEDILKCKEVILCLRPHLDSDIMADIILEMFSEGYQLAYIEEENKAVAFIGYRYMQFLYNGKHIYIDDLSTLPSARGKGYGSLLISYVEQEAIKKGYKLITLDSGFQRMDAHRLYLNKRFKIDSFHFSKSL